MKNGKNRSACPKHLVYLLSPLITHLSQEMFTDQQRLLMVTAATAEGHLLNKHLLSTY